MNAGCHRRSGGLAGARTAEYEEHWVGRVDDVDLLVIGRVGHASGISTRPEPSVGVGARLRLPVVSGVLVKPPGGSGWFQVKRAGAVRGQGYRRCWVSARRSRSISIEASTHSWTRACSCW